MDLEFHKAYLVTPEGPGEVPTVAIGFKRSPSTWKPTEELEGLEEFTFVNLNEDHPVRKIVGKVVSDSDDEIVVHDYNWLLRENKDVSFRIVPLTMHLWHKYNEYIPHYDRLFDELHTDDDVQRFYLEDLLEPTLRWRPEGAVKSGSSSKND